MIALLFVVLLAGDPLATLPANAAGATVRRAFDHHGGFETWAAGRLTGNHLTYGPGQHDYTEYHDDMVVDGITLARRRLGFGADGSRRKGPRTSEIVYEDVKFDVPLDERLFASPATPPSP